MLLPFAAMFALTRDPSDALGYSTATFSTSLGPISQPSAPVAVAVNLTGTYSCDVKECAVLPGVCKPKHCIVQRVCAHVLSLLTQFVFFLFFFLLVCLFLLHCSCLVWCLTRCLVCLCTGFACGDPEFLLHIIRVRCRSYHVLARSRHRDAHPVLCGHLPVHLQQQRVCRVPCQPSVPHAAHHTSPDCCVARPQCVCRVTSVVRGQHLPGCCGSLTTVRHSCGGVCGSVWLLHGGWPVQRATATECPTNCCGHAHMRAGEQLVWV